MEKITLKEKIKEEYYAYRNKEEGRVNYESWLEDKLASLRSVSETKPDEDSFQQYLLELGIGAKERDLIITKYGVPVSEVGQMEEKKKAKFRVGKKQHRAILEIGTGKEYLVFPVGSEKACREYCKYLNGLPVPNTKTVEGEETIGTIRERFRINSGKVLSLDNLDEYADWLEEQLIALSSLRSNEPEVRQDGNVYHHHCPKCKTHLYMNVVPNEPEREGKTKWMKDAIVFVFGQIYDEETTYEDSVKLMRDYFEQNPEPKDLPSPPLKALSEEIKEHDLVEGTLLGERVVRQVVKHYGDIKVQWLNNGQPANPKVYKEPFEYWSYSGETYQQLSDCVKIIPKVKEKGDQKNDL